MFVRQEIARMSGYTPGEQPGARKIIKLNTNENPYPPSQTIAPAVATAVQAGLQKYPDPHATAFRACAGDVLGFDPEWILCGNGSDDILTICTRAFVGSGETIRFPHPSYLLYKILADIQGACVETVDFNTDWTLPDKFAAPSEGLKLVFLPNPNSPSGTVLSPERIAELARQLDCPLLVDEAYADFAEVNCLSLVREHPNVLVCRTLSKSYGLAGLRFGFLVAQPEVIAELNKVKDSYNCDALSIAAATAAIHDQAWLQDNRRKITAGRDQLANGLRELGFNVPKSSANFVFAIHPTAKAKDLFDALKSQGVLVRYMAYDRWPEGIRVSVGTPEQNELLLDMLRELTA
ncbi:MAG: histidinol-phosphate transaminase [Pirellulales bacterium]|nr:histidinol-phosphate transaminase [Pirellulales bacterium]